MDRWKNDKICVWKGKYVILALQIKSSFPLTVHKYSSYGFRESNIVAVRGVFHCSIANDIDAGYFTSLAIDISPIVIALNYTNCVFNIV